MALLRPYALRKHPLFAGILWAVFFVPTFLLIMWVTGMPIHGLRGVLVLSVLSLFGGLMWGLTMKAFVAAQGDRK